MSEHVMFKDIERHKIVCALCKTPWPCVIKANEIMAKIRQQQEANKA